MAESEWTHDFDNDFEVYCCPGEKYDFSTLMYNNMIDGELRELMKANIPYEVMDVHEHAKKYDIDTDTINEVTIIELQNYVTKGINFRIVAPEALIEYWEMISGKISSEDTVVIIRKENDELIECHVKGNAPPQVKKKAKYDTETAESKVTLRHCH